MTVTWPEQFITHFSNEQILRLDYLTGTPTPQGTFPCKVCGNQQVGSREKHFEQHKREFEAFVKAREAAIKQQRLKALGVRKVAAPKSEFYAAPCKNCNAQIPRTGKRGKPPVLCSECKEAKNSPTKVICGHEKSDGSPCGMKPLKGSDFCRWHQK